MKKDSPSDHTEDSLSDHVKDSPSDHTDDCPLDHIENSPLDHIKDSPSDHIEDCPLDHIKDSSSDKMEDSSSDKMEGSSSNETKNSSEDSSPDKTKDSSPDETKDSSEDSPTDETTHSLAHEDKDTLSDKLNYSPEHLKTMFPLPDNYKVESFLGEGGFGHVIKCFKKDTKETVAVKVPRDNDDDDDDDSSIEYELSVLNYLKSKKLDDCNIMKFIEKFTLEDNRPALAFEMLDMTLFDYIVDHKDANPLDLHEVRAIVQQMATALNALKSNEVIHSDIKLDNIMVVDRDAKPIRVKLIDFGLALPTFEAKQGTILQTVNHRAPEVHLGLPFSEAIDMWSLGAVMAQMTLCCELFPGDSKYDVVHLIVDLLGVPPDHLLNAGCYSHEYFKKTPSGGWTLKTPEEFCEMTTTQVDERIYDFHSLDDLETVSLPSLDMVEADEKKEFLDLLKAMLQMDPKERITPTEVLNHPFITRGSVQHSSDSMKKLEDPSENSPVEGDTDPKKKKKKKKKNYFKRFCRWMKKTFCCCVSANDDED